MLDTNPSLTLAWPQHYPPVTIDLTILFPTITKIFAFVYIDPPCYLFSYPEFKPQISFIRKNTSAWN